MKMDKYLSREQFNWVDFEEYINEKGINNIRKKDLDKIIEKFGFKVVMNVHFIDLYNIVSTEETNKSMKRWTICTGIMTIVVTIATIINLYLFAGTLK